MVRDRLGQREDRSFASVFLGSGLLFVAMPFVAAAVAGGLIPDEDLHSGGPGASALLELGRRMVGLLLQGSAMRMAAVFTMSMATIARCGPDSLPRWIGQLGIVVAVVLLVSVGLTPWVDLLFPAWVLLLSVDLLRAALRESPGVVEGRRPRRRPVSGPVVVCGLPRMGRCRPARTPSLSRRT